MEEFYGCEKSFIPMKLIRLNCLVFTLGNRAMKPCIETGLICTVLLDFLWNMNMNSFVV